MSLGELKRKSDKKYPDQKDKGPSETNLADLRSALASALAKEPKPSVVSPHTPSKQALPASSPQQETKPSVDEVPRDVLENILNVENP
jgi:hypothetical protein